MAKTREAGRFVTLQSKRVIFIPKGYKKKWGDVKDAVLGGKKGKAGAYDEIKQLIAAGAKLTAPQMQRLIDLRSGKGARAKERPISVAGRRAYRKKARHRRWEREGLKPGDFGVDIWDDVDPDVVEAAVRRAGYR